MSDLLNSASLVMIPSGYKEDTVYSVVPSDGSGDLSFTRASNGTRVNSAGLVEDCPWNLNTNSEDFATGWTGANRTLTANATTAPNGTTTADQLGATGGTAYYAKVITSSEGQNAFSVYLKYGNRQYQQIYAYSSGSYFAQAVFDLQNGTVSSVVSGSATIENIGNGWYRCTISGASGGTTIEIGIENIAVSTYTYAWGAQLNIGSTAKPYFPTTDRLNVPRLTYQNGGGGCPSLLLEKQSTNLTLYSDQLDNAVHTALGVTTTANNITSPDGTQNADKITETTANSEHVIYDLDSNSSGTYTLSAFFKGGAGTIFPVLRLNGADATAYAGCIFNTSTGAVVNTFYNTYSAPTTKVENMGNGWYRVSMTTTTTNTNYGMRIAASDSASPSVGAYGAISYTGSTSNYFYAWGAQVEASSYPTSYIPTTLSSATRVADAYQKAGFGNTSTAATLYYEFSGYQPFSPANGLYMIQLFAGSSVGDAFFCDANSISIIANGANIEGRNNGYSTTLFTFAPTTATVKVALRYDGTNVVAFLNGVKQTVYSDTAVGIKNAFRVNNGENGTHATKELVFFPIALTDAECIALTTI